MTEHIDKTYDPYDAPLDRNFPAGGRVVTNADGGFLLTTIKPGPYRAAPGSWRAPHIHFSLVGPSFMDRMVTQMHFAGEVLNEYDLILNAVQDPEALSRLIAEALPPARTTARSHRIACPATNAPSSARPTRSSSSAR